MWRLSSKNSWTGGPLSVPNYLQTSIELEFEHVGFWESKILKCISVRCCMKWRKKQSVFKILHRNPRKWAFEFSHRKSCKGLHGVMKSQFSIHHLSTVYLLLTHQNTFFFSFFYFCLSFFFQYYFRESRFRIQFRPCAPNHQTICKAIYVCLDVSSVHTISNQPYSHCVLPALRTHAHTVTFLFKLPTTLRHFKCNGIKK